MVEGEGETHLYNDRKRWKKIHPQLKRAPISVAAPKYYSYILPPSYHQSQVNKCPQVFSI